MKLERQIEASDMMLLSSRKEELIESHRLKATSELADVDVAGRNHGTFESG